MSAALTIDIPTKADLLIAAYMRAGYARLSPAILQPAEPFLDLSGEDIRRRMFLTSDPAGRELCLRPDLTIPVVARIIWSRRPPASRRVSVISARCFAIAKGAAGGIPAGRHRVFRPDVIRRRPTPRCSRSGLEATTHYGLHAPEIRMGDVGLFAAFIAALDLAPAWKRRLIKDFIAGSAGPLLGDTIDNASGTARPPERAPARNIDQGVLAALAGSDPKAAHHLVTDLLSIAGIATVGGRSRRRNRRPLPRAGGARRPTAAAARDPRADRALPRGRAAIPDEAAAELRALAADAKISLGAALDLFETRTGFLAARGIDVRAIELLDRLRARHRLLHRLRVRAALIRMTAPAARWSPAAAMTAC